MNRISGLNFLILGVLAGAAGCKVGPDYKPPQPQVPDQWMGAVSAVETPPEAAKILAQWWIEFKDPILTDLIEQAFESNLDLKQAESRIQQARMSRQIVFSAIGPTVDATGSFNRQQSPGTQKTGKGPTNNLYQAGFDASWELDVFGGVRRGIEAAEASIVSAEESRRNIWITLAGEVASNYIDLRAFQDRIIIAQRNLKSQQETAALTRKRFEGEFNSRLDVANAQAQVYTTKSVIPTLEAAAQQIIYTLSILLGREPGALMEQLAPSGPIPAAPPTPPAGVPSELLRRRPDIRKVEADIHAATAQIGVAEADFFPKFNINSTYGRLSGQSGHLFEPYSQFWSLGPGVTWRIFDTGRILSNIELQKILQEQSVLTYRQTVLGALQEVENALIASVKEKEHYQALAEAVAANRKAVELSTLLYTEGLTDFLNVLNAQRSLFVTEDALSQSQQNLSIDLVSLYKALGGGWEDPNSMD